MFKKIIVFVVLVELSEVLFSFIRVESKNVESKNKNDNKVKVDFLQVNEDDYDLNQRINTIYEDLSTVLEDNSSKQGNSSASLSSLLDKTKELLEIFEFEKNRQKIIIKQTNDTENKPIKIPMVTNNSVVNHLHIEIENIPMKVVYLKNAIIIETTENADEEKLVIENDVEHDTVSFICEENVIPELGKEVSNMTAKKDNVTKDNKNKVTTKDPTEVIPTTTMGAFFLPTLSPPNEGMSSDFADYDNNDDDNKIDYLTIDYLELFKDTTNEIPPTTTDMAEVEDHTHQEEITKNGDSNTTTSLNGSCNNGVWKQTATDVTFPWVAAIFVRNNSNNEFEYICDGAILGERAILTAARCLGNSSADDVLVLLGKRSLQKMDGNEVYRIQETIVHENYTSEGDNAHNDLVMLVPDKSIVYNELIQKACLLGPQGNKEEIVDSITTGWHITGDLIDIRLDTSRNDTSCFTQPELDNVFCASYDNSKRTCPSYGGLHLVKMASNMWYLDGLLTEDTRNRGVCFHKSRRFTDLTRYETWLKENGLMC